MGSQKRKLRLFGTDDAEQQKSQTYKSHRTNSYEPQTSVKNLILQCFKKLVLKFNWTTSYKHSSGNPHEITFTR